jgi:DNA anti-recombination protein RmuC
MPGDGSEPVYLVIDSKSPSVTYARLQQAYESGDKARCDAARKAFVAELRKEAADIYRKYVKAPNSLDYGIMFLPSEGMYGEALRLGMVEILRRESHVMIAGPSSMAALLSSFRVGFQMLAIHEKSEDIRRVLEEVRTMNYLEYIHHIGDKLLSILHTVAGWIVMLFLLLVVLPYIVQCRRHWILSETKATCRLMEIMRKRDCLV